ncbi:MAG: hypothetical protein J2P21_04245 [Chloracidobacterium sp.]|nr:hypothetical protein [Chloracidobacterium sp.]
MPNKITVYLGPSGAIGAIELEVIGLNDLYPINANTAPNANGPRVEPGEYIFDSIAYTPKTQEIQTAYGGAIIRFTGENRSRLAIFGGETGPDGGLLPTEGASIRVMNDVLERIVNYIEERGGETLLIVTDDEPGLINNIRIGRWYGQPADTGQISLIRPTRFKGEKIERTFYTDDYYDDSDWLMWEILHSLGDDAAAQTDFYQTYDKGWVPEAGVEPPFGYERSEEEPYIADPFVDTEEQSLTFEDQIDSSDAADGGAGDTSDWADIDEAPDNNY